MRDELISLIETKGDLPPIPEVLLNLEKRVNDPDSDILEISAIIEILVDKYPELPTDKLEVVNW